MPLATIAKRLIIGASVMAGAFVGKAVVERMSLSTFQHVLDALLLVSRLTLLWAAFG